MFQEGFRNYPRVMRGRFSTRVTYMALSSPHHNPALLQPDERTARAYAAELSSRARVEVSVHAQAHLDGILGGVIETYVNGEAVSR